MELLLKRLCFFSLLVVTVLSIQSVCAAIYLPDSSYAEEQENWQGSVIHEDQGDGYKMLIEFAVYDQQNLLGGSGEQALVDALGLEGQYIYAYQIFNHPDDFKDIGSFGIIDIEGMTNGDATWVDGADFEDEEGVDPEVDSFKEAAWKFAGFGLESAQHSSFMAFSSDSAPVVGNYELNEPQQDSDFPNPTDEVPEPVSALLFGLGGAMCMKKRKRVSNAAKA